MEGGVGVCSIHLPLSLLFSLLILSSLSLDGKHDGERNESDGFWIQPHLYTTTTTTTATSPPSTASIMVKTTMIARVSDGNPSMR